MRQGFSLPKVMRVAGREFASTALTKGFIIGALIVPAAMVLIIPLIAILMVAAQPEPEKGTVVVVDRTGLVADRLAERVSEDAIRERRSAAAERVASFAKDKLGGIGEKFAGQAGQSAEAMPVPQIRLRIVDPAGADTDALKEEVRAQLETRPEDPMDKLLGIIEIDPDAVQPGESTEENPGGFGGWQAFFRPRVNEETVGEIENSVNWSIRESRFELAAIDSERINELRTVDQRASQEITDEGERNETSSLTGFIIPIVSMLLLFIATLTGGQYLLTTTIEEKSSRVVEVLLSAVSPMELMTGKILGQMAVGLSLLVVYNSVGIAALISLSLTDLISPLTLLSFFAYFILAYFMYAAMMAAIGAAVSDIREAQSLMTPVMLLMMVPYLMMFVVPRAPNSAVSTTLSFIPPFSPFIMIMRIASPEPTPLWQIGATLLINLLAVWVLLWLAAKVFRVGLLMYGKPPNVRTLIRWIRMA